MGTTRRLHAMHDRERAQRRRISQREQLRSVQAGPVCAWTCDGRTALFFAGPEHIIRNGYGEIVYAEKGPEFLLGEREYGRIMSARPQALSARVRAKRSGSSRGSARAR